MQKIIKKPNSFSDPYNDFSKEELDRIIAKKDKDLECYDFNCIFQSLLPAGTYEECLYFVPIVLNYIETYVLYSVTNRQFNIEMENDISQVIDNFLHWKEQHQDVLHKDSMDILIENQLNIILCKMLFDFQLHKTNDGYISPNFDSMMESFVVGILKYKSLAPLKVLLQNEVIPTNSYKKSAWLITICSYPRQIYNIGKVSVVDFWEYEEKSVALKTILQYLKNKNQSLTHVFWEQTFSSIILSII